MRYEVIDGRGFYYAGIRCKHSISNNHSHFVSWVTIRDFLGCVRFGNFTCNFDLILV